MYSLDMWAECPHKSAQALPARDGAGYEASPGLVSSAHHIPVGNSKESANSKFKLAFGMS